MLIVVGGDVRTERELTAGEFVVCSERRGDSHPWGQPCQRPLHTRAGRRRLHPRRTYCRNSGRTHVLVSGVRLTRRSDAVEDIAAASTD